MNAIGVSGRESLTDGTRCGALDCFGNAEVCTTSAATTATTSVVAVPTTSPRNGRMPSGCVVSAVSSCRTQACATRMTSNVISSSAASSVSCWRAVASEDPAARWVPA